jgi:hypothetical protein
LDILPGVFCGQGHAPGADADESDESGRHATRPPVTRPLMRPAVRV